MQSTRRRADSTATKSSQIASHVAQDVVAGLAKGPNGSGVTAAAVTTLAEPASSFATTFDLPLARVGAAERIAAGDALERALRFLAHTAITVVGSRAEATAAWLRRAGYQAEPLTLNGHPPMNVPVLLASDLAPSHGDVPQFLSALKEMLAPDGLLVAVVPNLTHARTRIAMLLGRFTMRSSGSAPSFTLTDAERLLQDAAFTVIDVERQLDTREALKDMSDGVPEPVVSMLADDVDAMTSHFVVLAEPQASASLARAHRRLSEIAATHRQTTRDVDRIERRVSDLEVRVKHWAGETDRLALRDVTHANGPSSDRVTDGERDEALSRARERLLVRAADIKALTSRIERVRYRREILRIRQLVGRDVPAGSTVAVISRGDEELLAFGNRKGWHFPRTDKGVYAGHHPADSGAAIAHLEELRARGAQYLLIPRTAFWWLEHYKAFSEYLQQRCRCLRRDERTCVLFALGGGRAAR
jgi:hypothetical protein